MQLAEMKIIVTGAASGMGRDFALALVRSGAHVAACDINTTGLEQLEREARNAQGTLKTFVADVSNELSVQTLMDNAWTSLSGFNGLINNAGIFRDALLVKQDKATRELKAMSLAEWRQVIDVDLTGPFLCTREFALRVIEHGVKSSVVVNMSSLSRHGNIGQSNYSAAKAGLVADTAVWAKELARYGIRVAAVCPGFVDTPLLDGMRPELVTKMVASIPLQRLASTHDIWTGVRFAIECDYFTGRCLDIDGGLVL